MKLFDKGSSAIKELIVSRPLPTLRRMAEDELLKYLFPGSTLFHPFRSIICTHFTGLQFLNGSGNFH